MSRLLLLFAVVLLGSCAVQYKPVVPAKMNFQNRFAADDKLAVSYIYDVQGITTNKRYARREREHGFAAVALQIKNISAEPVTITRSNFKVLVNGSDKEYVTPEKYTSKVKQLAGLHLLHALWGPWAYQYEETPAGTSSRFRYIPIGATIGLINLIIAATANGKHLETLKQNEIFGKTIAPGEQLHGIVLIANTTYEPLTFRLVE